LVNLAEYVASAKRAKNVLELRLCSVQQVRVARGNAVGKYRWFCTPDKQVRGLEDADQELLDTEAEVHDNVEAAQFDTEVEVDDETFAGECLGDEWSGESGVFTFEFGEEQEVDEDGFVYLFGEALAEWLRIRVERSEDGSKVLSNEEACGWGLTEARDIEWAGTWKEEDDTDMIVPADRILFWDGSKDASEFPGTFSVKNLETNCFYGSTSEEVREGARAKWHPILFYTLERIGLEGSREGDEHVTLVPGPDGDNVVLNSLKLHLALDHMYDECKKRPNCPFRTDAQWSRPASIRIQGHLDTSAETFAQSKERECAKCAVLNAAIALRPNARQFILQKAKETPPARARFLKDLAKWTEKEMRVFSLRYAFPKKGKDREEVSLDWVLENTADVLLVNLIGSGGVNHVVCVDARENHRCIYDSFERHPIELNEDSLRCCVGDDRVLQHVLVRKLVLMPNADAVIRGERDARMPNGRKRRRMLANRSATNGVGVGE